MSRIVPFQAKWDKRGRSPSPVMNKSERASMLERERDSPGDLEVSKDAEISSYVGGRDQGPKGHERSKTGQCHWMGSQNALATWQTDAGRNTAVTVR